MRFAFPLAAFCLALASCTAGSGPVQSAAMAGEARVETLTANELAALIEAGQVVLIDVRTPQEFTEARLAGSLNAPLGTFDPASIPMEAGRETILYCASSRRSGIAAEQLAAYIGGTVRHLEGGIGAWQEAGLETIAD